ncbi:MAG: hypothetical protein JST02_16070 [Bacteroidetes bacterium]|nr:hypothetical protein [Bacteroidota bacterium]
MKKSITIFITFLLLQSALQAQVKTSFGDEVGTLDGIIKAYYDVVTVKKGEKVSYQRDSCLHVPNPSVGMARKGKDGKVKLQLITLKQFHEASDAALEKDGFYEREISRKVENFGAIYHVWSTYETKNTADGPVTARGINSIQLYFDGTRFWILSWVFDEESEQNPIPKKYLQN